MSDSETAAKTSGASKEEIPLYYPLADLSGIAAFQVEVEGKGGSLTDWSKALVRALATSPSPSALAVFPEGTTLRNVFREGGILYLDFPVEPTFQVTTSVDFERLSLAAIVKTFTLQISNVDGIKILGNGVDRELFWGHFDIRQPLTIHGGRW